MTQSDLLVENAKKTFLALKNPYGTVNKVFPGIIDSIKVLYGAFGETVSGETLPCYLGVKDTNVIPRGFVKNLEKKGFLLHTLDPASFGGRAVDVFLRNPLTGLPMTGSSSATAINVLLGINDVGVGTDGGGSVLAPAMSINLFSLICPLIEADYRKTFSKKSTDNIVFSPSIGFITREFDLLEAAATASLDFVLNSEAPFKCLLNKNQDSENSESLLSVLKEVGAAFEHISFPEITAAPRAALIDFLNRVLLDCDFLISYEGPVDLLGMGDSVFGHFDRRTESLQALGGKGLVKVANMVDATAITVPSKELASAFVLICQSLPAKIAKTLSFAKKIALPQDELLKRYFLNSNNHFPKGFNE